MAIPIAIGLMIGGTIMQAKSQYEAGKAEESANKANAAIAARNAEIAKTESAEKAREARKEGRSLLAKQIVLFAKSGVKAGVGTPLIVSEETKKQMERRARIIQEYGASEAEIYGMQSSMFKKMAKAAGRGALWSAGGTLATGLGTAGLMAYKYRGTTTKTMTSSESKSIFTRRALNPYQMYD